MLQRCHKLLNDLLNQPSRIFWMCVSLICASLVFDGTAFRMWSLSRDYTQLTERIETAKARNKSLESQVVKAQRPEYIERAARDQFDFVHDGDLVFIFSDDGTPVTEKTAGISP